MTREVKKEDRRRHVFVIGAGASGMMAAIRAAREGARVTVLEANERAGRKLAATGNGRCNFTNLTAVPDAYRGNNPSFIETALHAYSVEDTIRFFEELGLYPAEEDGRLYPRSMQAQSVVDLLRREMDRLGVTCKYQEHVESVRILREARKQELQKEGAASRNFEIKTGTWQYQADTLILACGSKASSIAGSGEDGYRLAKSLGHTIWKPLPALVPLSLRGVKFSAWAGVRTKGKLTLLIEDVPAAIETGELQLTDYGISGIPAMVISRYAAKALDEGKKVFVSIDFLPEISLQDMPGFWKRRKEACPDKNTKELLVGLFPDKLIRVLAAQEDVCKAIKGFCLDVEKTLSFSHAQVCQGGVDTREIDPLTMRSLRCPGLYLTGELLDVDGTCGGYNLQWAWTSGTLAGRAAAWESFEAFRHPGTPSVR